MVLANILWMMGIMRLHCSPDTGFDIRRPSRLPLGHGDSHNTQSLRVRGEEALFF